MNPWLILGGTLLMAVLSVQGGTTVSGFQSGGQDTNAKADISNLRLAEEGQYALNGSYATTVGALNSTNGGVSTMYMPSAGVLHALAVNSGGTAYVVVAQSSSGKYFAAISSSSAIGSGDTLAAALTAAGATSAWATANGVTLPTAVS